MKKIKEWIRRYVTLRFIIGLILGGIAGYLYYHFIGCRSGTCPIQSNPYLMILYGLAIGGILFYKKKTS